jgi:hypothetical protein
LLRLAEGTFQADKQQPNAASEKQEIHPGNIARNRKSVKHKKIAGKRDQAEQRSRP